MENRNPHRHAGLDVLRAVALLLVLVCHSVPCPEEVSKTGAAIWLTLKHGGWTGVDLFFVLSGFLVGRLLLSEFHAAGKLDLRRFYLRRGFKIYPLFWINVGFIISWKLWVGMAVTPTQLAAELLFFQNYVTGVWGTNWSLGVEEHFYVLLPVLLLLLGARAGGNSERLFRRLPWVVLAIALFCLGFRAYAAATQPFATLSHLTPTHLRIDGLFFGVLLAALLVFRRSPFLRFCRTCRWALLTAGISGLLPAFLLPLDSSWYIHVPGLAVHWLAAGALICFTLGIRAEGSPLVNVVASIGRNSYASYLWHYWIGNYALAYVATFFGFRYSWPQYILAYFGATLASGALLTALFEKPFLILRDRMVPKLKPLSVSEPADDSAFSLPFTVPATC